MKRKAEHQLPPHSEDVDTLKAAPSQQECLSDDESSIAEEKPVKRKKPLRKKVHLKVLGTVDYHTQQQSPLLRLPGELRAMIWEYAFTTKSGEISYNVDDGKFDLSEFCGPSRVGLYAACHMVALETKYLSVKMNLVIFVGGNLRDKIYAFYYFLRMLRVRERKLRALIVFYQPEFAVIPDENED